MATDDADRGNRALTLMVLGICAALLLPTLGFRMGVDQGVFAYMGAQLLHGHWPYVGTWESDFPGLVFLQALEILAFGTSIVMFRLFDLLVQLLNAWLIYRIGSRVGSRAGGYVAAAVYVLIYQGYGPWNTAQREGFALPFVLAGFWLLLTAERRTPARTAAGIGLGIGVAVLFKPSLLFLAVAYLPLARKPNRETFRLLVIGGIASAVPGLIVVAIYAVQGELRALYEACIAYQAIYTQRLRGDDPFWLFWLTKLTRLGRTTVALAVAYVPFLLLGPRLRERRILYLGFVGSIYAVLLQGTFAGYHYLPGLAIGAILIGTMFSIVGAKVAGERSLRWGRVRIALPFLLAHLVVLAAIPVYLRAEPLRKVLSLRFLDPPRANEFRNRTVFDFTESWDVAAYLREHTAPGEPVQVWGYESLVYYLAGRPAASRFQMTHPLVMRVPGKPITEMQKRWRREFLEDVARKAPAYVAVVRDDNWWWAPEEKTSERLLDDFPEWKAYLEGHYAAERTIGRFLILRRIAEKR